MATGINNTFTLVPLRSCLQTSKTCKICIEVTHIRSRLGCLCQDYWHTNLKSTVHTSTNKLEDEHNEAALIASYASLHNLYSVTNTCIIMELAEDIEIGNSAAYQENTGVNGPPRSKAAVSNSNFCSKSWETFALTKSQIFMSCRALRSWPSMNARLLYYFLSISLLHFEGNRNGEFPAMHIHLFVCLYKVQEFPLSS